MVTVCAVVAALGLALPSGVPQGEEPTEVDVEPPVVAAPRAFDLAVPASGTAGFSELSSERTGVDFANHLSEKDLVGNWLLHSGSGVALGDVDGDGRCDIYLCRLEGPNALYRNLGDFRFEDVTAEAGVGLADRLSHGACLADLDGDGDLDLIVSCSGPNAYFVNQGDGRFVAAEQGLAGGALGSRTWAVADVDRDGDLDVYLANSRMESIRGSGKTLDLPKVGGRLVVPPELKDQFVVHESGSLIERGGPDALYLNHGEGRFAPAPPRWFGGPSSPERLRDWGLTARFQDVDADGWPDLYVCNDFWTPDRLWINRRGKGLALSSPNALRSTSYFSMSVSSGDIDRDGDVDLFVSDMLSREHERRKRQMGDMVSTETEIGDLDNVPQVMRNTLQLNRGDGTFAEIAQLAGVQASEWTWGTQLVDLDLDGFEDLLVATGYPFDIMDADVTKKVMQAIEQESSHEGRMRTMLLYPPLETPNLAFRNTGDLHFVEVGEAWGFARNGVSHGIALGDLDGDGDLDAVVNNFNAPASVLRNESNAPRVAVRLRGAGGNTQAVGACVRLSGGPVPQSAEVVCGGNYLSSNEALLVFAAGEGDMTLEVTWPGGAISTLEGVLPNRRYEISEPAAGTAPARRSPPSAEPEPWFEDATSRLNHTHAEAEFNDFARQSLLPNRLSQLGPGVAWFDVDGDGDDDLLVGSGRGGKLSLFENPGETPGGGGSFKRRKLAPALLDLTAVLGFRRGAEPAFAVGVSNFEAKTEGRVVGLECDAAGEFKPLVARGPAPASGPLALADVDGDGDLDLFVGGRVQAGRYPQPVSSLLFRNTGSQFEVDLAASGPFASLGLVSGATFADLDADGDPDLALACEWGPLRVFLNDDGAFREATQELGLEGFSGWWNGVAVGDFNADGRLDLVGTNWGLNSKYHASPERPARIYHGDFDQNGVYDIVEAEYDSGMCTEVPVRGLSCSSRGMPFVKEVTPTFAEFGASSLSDLYQDRLARGGKAEATHLEHTVFLRTESGYRALPLPPTAQRSAAFGVVAADLDGDGHLDLFLAQNFFAVQAETSRLDAGRGLVLRGRGDGTFEAVDGQRSGIRVYGEQRGCAVSDYDADGRLDLVVSQNGAATRLFHNLRAQPGVRVRVRGPAANPDGIGTQLRLLEEDGAQGPVYEVQAGAGYWSQNSSVLVLSGRRPVGVRATFPDGRTQDVAIPAAGREVEVLFE